MSESKREERYRLFVEQLKLNQERGMIKVRVVFEKPEEVGATSETLWAYPIGKKYAKINNLPFHAIWIGYGDIVEVEPTDDFVKKFVRVISRGSITVAFFYEIGDTEAETRDRVKQIGEHFRKYKIDGEGAMLGWISLAVPVDMPFEEAKVAMDTCPFMKGHSLQDASLYDLDIPEDFTGEEKP